MTFMAWRPEFSVGIAVFDEEHKKLIAIINELHGAISAGARPEDLHGICDNLVEYALMHFRHEEMYFRDWDYPDAEAHTGRHSQLRAEVFSFREQISGTDSGVLAEEMMEFLRQWLTIHIMVDDRAFGEFLLDKGIRG